MLGVLPTTAHATVAHTADWRALYPFTSRELRLGDARYHYVDEGRGEPVLFVHGNPTWSFYFRNLILGLRDRRRALAVDHVGCGLSDKPARYEYTLARHVANLVEFVDRLDLKNVALVGHDWGGAIGLGAALARPERFATLTLMNTAGFPPPYVPLRIRLCRAPWLGRWAIQGLNLFARAALWMATNQPARLTPPVRAGLLAPYDSWNNRRATYEFVADIPFTRRHPTWRVLADIEAGLPRLADKPVLLLWGARDWCFTLRCLDRFARAFPQARIERLEQAGHYVVEDAPEQVLEKLSAFLETNT